MSLNQEINKIQFRIDHAPFAYRVMILFGIFFMLFLPWYIFIYKPKANAAAEIETQIQVLQTQTQILKKKYENILALVKDKNTDKLIVKYQELQEQKRTLHYQILHFHHRYINDKDLANFLHDILKEIHGVEIDNFSTVAKTEPAPPTENVKPSPLSKKTAPPKTPIVAPDLTTEKTYYSLRLKGDYFAIIRFLQRIENIKWQLFWDKIDYKVQEYPIAKVTIEFFTLKPNASPVELKEDAK